MERIQTLIIKLFIASLILISANVHAQTPDGTLVKVGNYTLAETPPTGYNKYLYKGNIVLKPGFISVAGKEQRFGPNVEITDQVNSGYTIGYSYDNLGNVIEQTVVDDSSTNTVLSYTYEYDNTSRLSKVYTKSKSETSYKEEASYSYNNDDNIGSALFSGGEQISYTYDVKVGWLTAISAMNGSTSRFTQSLAYLNNGNVSSQTIYNSLLTTPTSVTSYTYDDQNRLAASTRSGNSESYTYDKDGAFETKGNLTYNYVSGSHKLTNVNSDSMQYDGKGNITNDGTSGVALQDYTYFNLPLQITKNSVVTNYAYNNAGSRINKTNVGTEEYYLYDYTGKVLLVKNKKTPTKSIANVYGNGLIGKIENVFGTTPERYYYIKDHLGSVRMMIQKHATSNEAVLAYDYYPYGEMIIPNVEVGDQNERYMFTEKERDAESSYDYFGARYYNSKLGIWLQVDPLTEKYPGWSPYNYTLANPLRFIDADGRVVGDPITLSAAAAAGVAIGAGIVLGVTIKTAEFALKNGGRTPSILGQTLMGVKLGFDILNSAKNLFSKGGEKESIPNDAEEEKIYAPDRALPTDEKGRPIPDSENPHSQLGTRQTKNPENKYPQAREWGKNGEAKKDIDFTDHGTPQYHPKPHQHKLDPETGKRIPGTIEPLK